MGFDTSAIHDDNAKNTRARIDAVALVVLKRLLQTDHVPHSMRSLGEMAGDKAYELAYGFEAARTKFYKGKGL